MTTPQCPRNLGRGAYIGHPWESGTRLRVPNSLTRLLVYRYGRETASLPRSPDLACLLLTLCLCPSLDLSSAYVPLSSSTLGAHAQRWFCPSVWLSVSYHVFSATMRNKQVKSETNGFSATLTLMAIFVKVSFRSYGVKTKLTRNLP